jgi:hypothetical protein
MKRVAEHIKDKYSPWGWMGQRAHDAEALNRVLPLDFIISCNYGKEVPLFFRENDVFSVEKINGIRKNWSNEDLEASLKGVLGRKVRERWRLYERQVSLLCYRSINQVEKPISGQRKKPLVMAVPEKLKHYFDNKLLLHNNLKKLDLPEIERVIGFPGKFTFNGLRKNLGVPFVVQFPYGSSGSATHIIRAEKEYNALRRRHGAETAIIRRYLNGFSLNINAVVITTSSGARTVCSFPSIQITGAPECSNSRAAYCGNDYAATKNVEKGIIKEVYRQTRQIGSWMALSGYKGIFGMDFLVRSGKVYPVEINPRFQNSTSLHTTLTLARGDGERSAFLLHIAEFLKKKDNILELYTERFKEDVLTRSVDGAQIIVSNGPREGVVTGDVLPGIYRMVLGKLVYFSATASLFECRSSEDILLTCGIPEKYTRVEPHSAICKIQILSNVLDPSGKKRFTPEAKAIIREVYSALKIKDPSRVEVPAP